MFLRQQTGVVQYIEIISFKTFFVLNSHRLLFLIIKYLIKQFCTACFCHTNILSVPLIIQTKQLYQTSFIINFRPVKNVRRELEFNDPYRIAQYFYFIIHYSLIF